MVSPPLFIVAQRGVGSRKSSIGPEGGILTSSATDERNGHRLFSEKGSEWTEDNALAATERLKSLKVKPKGQAPAYRL